MWDTGCALPQRTASSINVTALQSLPISAAILVGQHGGMDPTLVWATQQVQVGDCWGQRPLSWNSLYPAFWGIREPL